MSLLTRHDKYTLAQEIEGYVEFVGESKNGDAQPVALPDVFVEHHMRYPDSRLPRVGAIATAPLIAPDGSLIAPSGLDRRLRTVFRIEPRLLACLPNPTDVDAAAAAAAMDFLVNDWLADVATDLSGKCILISIALTIIQRVTLPARPIFFVTAGKRGGGKTTALQMVVLAVTGRPPAAAPWSSSKEERRKAIFTYLADGMPAIIWDNLPVGTLVSCPIIEAVSTSATYTDRVLQQSRNETVPCFTTMAFTGNNIAPQGETASRSLVARLSVDRPDPENRCFRHSDPIGWTLEHQGQILNGLYTILLANPQLRCQSAAPRTRFKTWWRLVGSAVEHAAKCLADRDAGGTRLSTSPVDFARMFAESEANDEEGNTVADVLDALFPKFGCASFLSSNVKEWMDNSSHNELDGAALLKFFEPSGDRATLSHTTHAIGNRLKSILDAPMAIGNRVLTLKTIPDSAARKQASSYRVHVTREAAENAEPLQTNRQEEIPF